MRLRLYFHRVVQLGALGCLLLGGIMIGVGLAGSQTPLLIGFLLILTAVVLATQAGPARPPATPSDPILAAQERVRAVSEMGNMLGASLEYTAVLEATLKVGVIGLREGVEHERLVSMVLLFEGQYLKIATSRRLTQHDQQQLFAGRGGILKAALDAAEPIFAPHGATDPELGYLVAFQDARSVLVIPLRANFQTYGLLVFGSPRSNAFLPEHAEILAAIGRQATIALQNAVLYRDLLDEKERIIAAEEDARKKLARDLHDGPTQTIAAVAMRVNYARMAMAKDPSAAAAELEKIEELARRTTTEIRHMLFTLRPLVLETQGLLPALEQLRTKLKDTHDLELTLQLQPDIVEYIPPQAQGMLFYIIEEALNNARKHAKATQHVVRLYRTTHHLVVEIQDNGAGFDVEAVNANYGTRGSLGMINMQERAALVNGTLKVESAPGAGTKISVSVPLANRPPARANGTSTAVTPQPRPAPGR